MGAWVVGDGERQIDGVMLALVGGRFDDFAGLWIEFDFLISNGAFDGVWAEVETEDLAVAEAFAVSADDLQVDGCDFVLWIGGDE